MEKVAFITQPTATAPPTQIQLQQMIAFSAQEIMGYQSAMLQSDMKTVEKQQQNSLKEFLKFEKRRVKLNKEYDKKLKKLEEKKKQKEEEIKDKILKKEALKKTHVDRKNYLDRKFEDNLLKIEAEQAARENKVRLLSSQQDKSQTSFYLPRANSSSLAPPSHHRLDQAKQVRTHIEKDLDEKIE